MKSQAYSILVLLLLLLSSCKSDKVQTPQLTILPEKITLQVNETQQIQVTVSHSDLTPTFVSLNPKIATVDQEGVVRGVAAGETKVQVILQDIVRSVEITVSPGASVEITNQLPLLLFTEDYQDARIVEHEAKVGRIETPLVPINELAETVGYINKDLIIPTVAYGLMTNEGEATIIAGCSESVSLLSETRKMLAAYGFESLELLNDPERGYYYKGKNNDGVMVVIYRADLPDYNVQSIIMFVSTRFGGKAHKLHDVLPTAKDFPNYIPFLQGSLTESEVKDHEASLGLRALSNGSPEGTLLFDTKKERVGETNLNMAFYVVTPPSGGNRFIRIELNCAETVTELLDVTFQQYLGENGFGKPTYVKSKDFVFADCLTDPTLYVAFFVEPAKGDKPPFLFGEIAKNQSLHSNRVQAQYRVAELRAECHASR